MDRIKEICLGALSLVLLIIAVVITLTLNSGDIPTTMLPFDLDDATINYPELPDTINGFVNVVIHSVISIGCMCFWIFTERGQWRKNKRLYFAITIYFVLMGGVFVNLFTNIIKHYRGGLRPHFIAACHPNETIVKALREKDKSWVDLETTKVICSAVEKLDYRWSFPSGHSSEAFYGMVVSILIIQNINLDLNKNTWAPLVLPIKASVQFVMLSFASWVAVGRMVDYHHHWWDVLAGCLLGTLFAVVLAEWFLKPLMELVRETDAASSNPKGDGEMEPPQFEELGSPQYGTIQATAGNV